MPVARVAYFVRCLVVDRRPRHIDGAYEENKHEDEDQDAHGDMGVRMSARLPLPKSGRSQVTSAGICGAVSCSRPATPAPLGTALRHTATRAEDAICSTLGAVDGA